MTVPRALVTSHSFLDTDPRVRRTVDALLDAGFEVDALVLDRPRREGPLTVSRVPIGRRQGAFLRYAFEYGVFFVVALFWITHRVVAGRADIVYVNSPPDMFVFAAIAAKLARVPVVLDVHDPMPELFRAKGMRSRLVRKALEVQERWSLRFADRVVTVHEPLRELLLRRSPNADIGVVMNVPPTAGWDPIERDPSSRTLVYAGSVAYRYGLDDVLEAVALVADRIPSLRLRIVGGGEDVGRLQELAQQLGISDRVDFCGRVPWVEVRAAQKGAWLGVNVPKADELGNLSFSNKIVEWVAMELPVIAARSPTLLRYFPEAALFYVQAGSPESIAERLLELDAASPERIAQHVSAARQALQRISWPVQKRRLLAQITNAMAGGAQTTRT